jgi:hypothetical protein
MVKESTRAVRVVLCRKGSTRKTEVTDPSSTTAGGELFFLLAWFALEDGLRFVACPNEVVFNTESKDCQPNSQGNGTSHSGGERRIQTHKDSAGITQQKCRDHGRGNFERIRGACEFSPVTLYEFSSAIQKRKRRTRRKKSFGR